MHRFHKILVQNLARRIYQCNCGGSVFQEQRINKDTAALCLQRNLRMTLSQFNLTCQKCIIQIVSDW